MLSEMTFRRPKDIELDEFKNEAMDLESLRFVSRRSWYPTWTTQSDRHDTSDGAANMRTLRSSNPTSHWILRFISRLFLAPDRRAFHQVSSGPPFSESQNQFIMVILGGTPYNEIQDAVSWYISFLEYKIRESWINLFSPVLKDTDRFSDAPSREDLSVAFQILRIVALDLSRENFALTDIVDKLYNEKVLAETDEHRSHANQLVFAAIGWISALYHARLDPEPNKLQVINRRNSTKNSAIRRRVVSRPLRRTKTFMNYEQSLESNDQPFHTLLGRFGKIIPGQARDFTGQSTPPMRHERPNNRWLQLSQLCFYTLDKVASIKIELVDTLSLHLEFDSCTKTLKIFRLPSLCLLMCSCTQLSPLSQLFWDSDQSNSFLRAEVEDAMEFYREVLLSYRLIFGQDNISHKRFNKMFRKSDLLPKEYHDSLIFILCGQHWDSKEARHVYELIDAEDPSTHYSPTIDFPYLGTRLLELQTYVKDYKPSTFCAIWNDKRDPSEWWTFWAVILMGSMTLIVTILLGISQLVVGIFQAVYSREQLPVQ